MAGCERINARLFKKTYKVGAYLFFMLGLIDAGSFGLKQLDLNTHSQNPIVQKYYALHDSDSDLGKQIELYNLNSNSEEASVVGPICCVFVDSAVSRLRKLGIDIPPDIGDKTMYMINDDGRVVVWESYDTSFLSPQASSFDIGNKVEMEKYSKFTQDIKTWVDDQMPASQIEYDEFKTSVDFAHATEVPVAFLLFSTSAGMFFMSRRIKNVS